MYRRLNRSYSTNELTTPYGRMHRSPSVNTYCEKETTPTTNSNRRHSFYDLICRNCYRAREAKSAFTPISDPRKEKLNRSFLSSNPYVFQDKMDEKYKDAIQRKVNSRVASSNLAIENLKQFKKENSDPKESLILRNQYSTFSNFGEKKDPRYERMKKNYDTTQRIISKNPSLYDVTNPRKAVKDYYDKCVYEVPLTEPRYYIDKNYQENFREELKKQIEDKKKKNNEERTFQRLREKKGIEEYNRYMTEKNKNQNYAKLRAQKQIFYENKRLLEIKRQAEKEEKQKQKEYEIQVNEVMKAHDDKVNKERLQKKIKEIEEANNYMKEREKLKNKKKEEAIEERKKWNNYSEEFVVKCQHGNIYERCAICNNLFPRSKLIKCPKK